MNNIRYMVDDWLVGPVFVRCEILWSDDRSLTYRIDGNDEPYTEPVMAFQNAGWRASKREAVAAFVDSREVLAKRAEENVTIYLRNAMEAMLWLESNKEEA